MLQETTQLRARNKRTALPDLRRRGAHFSVDKAVRGEDQRASQFIRCTGKIADLPSRFFNEEDARGGIPFFKAEFPESVEAASSYIREIERRGPVAADSVGLHGEVAVILQIRRALSVVNRETGAEQTGGKCGIFRDLDFFAVERSAFPFCRGEKFIVNWIIDDSNEERAALREGNRNTKTRVAVGKICSAVERIDVPAKFGNGFVAEAFFGEDGMIGEIIGDLRDDGLLGAFVRLRDQVDFAFVSDLRRAGKLVAKNGTGLLGDFDGGLEIVFRHQQDSSAKAG